MAERLTVDRVERTVTGWRGAGDPFIPRTNALLLTLEDAKKRSRATVDVDDAYKRLRSRVGPDFPVADAVKEIEAVEKAALATKKAARIADLEAAAIAHQIVGVFTDELRAAWPLMRQRFDDALHNFTEAIAGVPLNVGDPKQAEAAGSAPAHQWHVASEASGQIAWLHRIVADLRELGVTPTIPAARGADWQWAEPSKVPLRRGRHHVAALRDGIRAGATPALLTFEEVKQRIQREAAAAAAARTVEVREPSLYARPRTILDTEAELQDAATRAERVMVIP